MPKWLRVFGGLVSVPMAWVLGMTCVGIGALFYLLWTSEWLGNKFSAKVSKAVSMVIMLAFAVITLRAGMQLREINTQAQRFEEQVRGETYWLLISLSGVDIKEEMVTDVNFDYMLTQATIQLNVADKDLTLYGRATARGDWSIGCAEHPDGIGSIYPLEDYPEMAKTVREEGVCRLPNT